MSVTPKELAHLGSPFAHTPAPADLIDLWDETERFFDALGDPHEFIEPEGTPTFNVDEPILSDEEEAEEAVKLLSKKKKNGVVGIEKDGNV